MSDGAPSWANVVVGLATLASAASGAVFSYLSWKDTQASASVADLLVESGQLNYDPANGASVTYSASVLNSGDVELNGCRAAIRFRDQAGLRISEFRLDNPVQVTPGGEARAYTDGLFWTVPPSGFVGRLYIETWIFCATRSVTSDHSIFAIDVGTPSVRSSDVTYISCASGHLNVAAIPRPAEGLGYENQGACPLADS